MLRYFLIYCFFLRIVPGYSQFLGGFGDGYNLGDYANSINIYTGGSEDGHGIEKYNNPISIFNGGGKDGNQLAKYSNSISIFSGGMLDGYDAGYRLMTFVWTGNIGEDWNEQSNWSSGIIPNLNSSVVIPNGAPNFPNIKAGLLVIDKDPSNLGAYFCKQIIIQPSAEMTLGINATLESYGIMDIQGSFCIMSQQ